MGFDPFLYSLSVPIKRNVETNMLLLFTHHQWNYVNCIFLEAAIGSFLLHEWIFENMKISLANTAMILMSAFLLHSAIVNQPQKEAGVAKFEPQLEQQEINCGQHAWIVGYREDISWIWHGHGFYTKGIIGYDTTWYFGYSEVRGYHSDVRALISNKNTSK